MDSEYRQEELGGGRIRFIVTPASAPTASLGPVLLGGIAGLTVFGTTLDHGNSFRPFLASAGGILVGLLVYHATKRVLVDRVDRRRSPGGTFTASSTGLELPTGSVIPREDIHRLTLRNGVPTDAGAVVAYAAGSVSHGIVVDPAVVRAPNPTSAANVSFMLCAEHAGRSTTLAGGMTEGTAYGLLEDAGKVLRLHCFVTPVLTGQDSCSGIGK